MDDHRAKTSDSMLDTVGIKHFYKALSCDDFKRKWKYLSNARHPTWIHNAKGSETMPNLTMILTPNGIYHLSAQVSLPKLLFGHNARLPNQQEVNQGLQIMAEYTEGTSGLPFDVQTATTSLIHFANDIQLTEPGVWQMVEKLSKTQMKPLRKNFYEDSTLYFTSRAKTRQIRIYPKLQAVLDEKNATKQAIEEANGNLRFEYCLLKKSAIDSLVSRYGLPDNKAQNLLTENVSDRLTSELLERLNFFDLLSNNKTSLVILREHFPTKKAMNLCGFLQMEKEYGRNFYKDESLGISKDSYYRCLRDCRKAKV